MAEVITKDYKKGEFQLSRKLYKELPEEEIPKQEGEIIQEANEESSEFRILKIFDDEVLCEDINTGIRRVFYKDSIKLSEKEKIRKRKAEANKRRTEKSKRREEKKRLKALRQAERSWKKQQREGQIKNRTFKRK